jgi:hypothetical protein
MRDIIERFSYRFRLWRREWREEHFGTPRTGPPDYVSHYIDRNRAALLTESTIRSVGRSVWVYFGIIIIVTQVCRIIGSMIPPARFALAITMLVLICFWTLGSIFFHIDLYKARKQYRQQYSPRDRGRLAGRLKPGFSAKAVRRCGLRRTLTLGCEHTHSTKSTAGATGRLRTDCAI